VDRRQPLSRPWRWRIATLAAVHLLIVAHIVHWRLAGTTLSSIQLSDAGRFAAEGVATGAFFLFAALLLVTAIFGRVFCAWGCHMLALQELSRWILGRLGVRPRLIRLRVLWIAPFAAAFCVFFQPALERGLRGGAFPAPRAELTSSQLWANLPGPAMAVVIVVCGFLMIYFLGSLSFCKYVCPYGALFAVADGFAVGRVRLTGACDGCAKCTAACTTGVRVHEHVQQQGMVADSGCMRCFECVAACPSGALAYRFGRPGFARRLGARITATYSVSVGEECVLLSVFAVGFVALYGTYDVLPLMLSVAASVVAAYLAVVALRMGRASFVQVRGIVLKRAGRVSAAGVVFSLVCAMIALLIGHSLLVQYHQRSAATALAALEFPRLRPAYDPAEQQLARAAAAHLTFCSTRGLVDTVEWQMQLAWLARVLREPDAVEAHLRRAIALDPGQPAAHFNLGKELRRQGRAPEAARAFAAAVRLAPALAEYVPRDLGGAS